MTQATTTTRKGYVDAKKWYLAQPLRLSEIPVPAWVSEPLPTRRLGVEAWIWFCAPAMLSPESSKVAVPDRWFAMDAQTGRLAAYAMEIAVPMVTAGGAFPAPRTDLMTLTPIAHTAEEQQAARDLLGERFDRLSDPFFVGRQAPSSNRRDLLDLLSSLVPKEIMPFYRALAPDFFAWASAAG